MGNLIHPIYIDGPFEGQDFPTGPGVPVQALDYGTPGNFSLSLEATYVTYQIRQFAFHSGGKAVMFWVGSCAPGEPDALSVFRALCKPELFDRAEAHDVPVRPPAPQRRP